MSMLTDWLDWALHHRRPDPPHEIATNPQYEMLLACYRSEQMSASQLRSHMDEDAAFKVYVEAQIANGDPVRASEETRLLVYH